MTRPAITGSRAHRVWQCPPSAALPGVIDDAKEARSEPARGKGKAIHRYLELVGQLGPDEAKERALAIDPSVGPLLDALDLSTLPTHLSTEVAFRYNWRTGDVLELGRGLDRDYAGAIVNGLPVGPASDDEIDLTIDLVGMDSAGRGYVGDYKSGHSKYPPPDKFAQTLLAAACVRELHQCDEVVLDLITIHDDGTHHAVRRTADDWEIAAWANDFMSAMALREIATQQIEAALDRGSPLPPLRGLHEGNHCDHCPAYKQCPAKVALVRSIPRELAAMGVAQNAETGALEISPTGITVRNAADAYEMAERIEEVLGQVKAQVCQLGYHQDIPLSDGRVIGLVKTSKRVVDPARAIGVATAQYGAAEAMKAFELKTSLDALRQLVVRHKGPKEKIDTRDGTGVWNQFLSLLGQAQALATNVSEAVKPHVPRKKRLTGGYGE